MSWWKHEDISNVKWCISSTNDISIVLTLLIPSAFYLLVCYYSLFLKNGHRDFCLFVRILYFISESRIDLHGDPIYSTNNITGISIRNYFWNSLIWIWKSYEWVHLMSFVLVYKDPEFLYRFVFQRLRLLPGGHEMTYRTCVFVVSFYKR